MLTLTDAGKGRIGIGILAADKRKGIPVVVKQIVEGQPIAVDGTDAESDRISEGHDVPEIDRGLRLV